MFTSIHVLKISLYSTFAASLPCASFLSYSAQNHLNLSKFLNKNIYIYLFLLNLKSPESEAQSAVTRRVDRCCDDEMKAYASRDEYEFE